MRGAVPRVRCRSNGWARLAVTGMIAWLLAGVDVRAQTIPRPTPSRGGVFVHFDNDFVEHTDRCYTGGLSVGWTSGALSPSSSERVRRIVPFSPDDGVSTWGIALGQKVYTPDDISIADVIVEDRPYAGALMLALSGTVSTPRQQRVLELSVGMVGPSAKAQGTQSLVHRLTPSGEPQGWQHQLRDEPILQLAFDERRRIRWEASRGQLAAELIPHVSGGLGNLATYAAVGAELRVGWKLPQDFGRAMLRPSGFRGPTFVGERSPSLEFFASADRKAVARDLLLDGNTFRSSHRVKREPFTSDIAIGIAANVGRLGLRYESVLWTRKFTTESRRQRYSSLLVRLARS
jgi:hypothetical protein